MQDGNPFLVAENCSKLFEENPKEKVIYKKSLENFWVDFMWAVSQHGNVEDTKTVFSMTIYFVVEISSCII